MRRGERMPAGQCAASSSTASAMRARSLASSSDSSTSAPPRPRRRTPRCSGEVTAGSEGGERLGRGLGDGEERVELGELEERLQILVQPRQAQVPALLADLLGERHQHAEAGGVDVAGLGKVDDELAPAAFQRVDHLLLQLLAIADDQLPVDSHDHDALGILRQAEAHPSLRENGADADGIVPRTTGGVKSTQRPNLALSARCTSGCTSADTSPPNRATSRTRLELR